MHHHVPFALQVPLLFMLFAGGATTGGTQVVEVPFALRAGTMVQADTVKRVRHEVACATCRVEFTKVASIGSSSDPYSPSRSTVLARDSRGRFYTMSDENRVLVYDERGRYLRAMGRPGSGPGEFPPVPQAIAAVMNRPTSGIAHITVGRGDSIYVQHLPLVSVSVFDSGYNYVRTVKFKERLTEFSAAHRLPDNTWLVGGEFRRSTDSIRHTMHLVDQEFAVLRSLGREYEISARGVPLNRRLPVYPFYPSTDGMTVWQASLDYAFEHWRVRDNTRLGRLEIHGVPWLATAQQLSRGGFVAGVSLEVRFVGLDKQGNAWLTGAVRRTPAPAREFEYVLEVVNPITGVVASSQRLEVAMRLLPGSDYAVSGRLDDDGFMIHDVWVFRYVGR